MRKLFILLVILLLSPVVAAQDVTKENVVCLVYFTGNFCDECGITDSFMDGLLKEYAKTLTAIKYNVDASQENRNIFDAYREAYNLPDAVPLVLFGVNDYLLGESNIFRHAESKVYSFSRANGTNCPLESGYLPPGEINPEDLPGQPEVYESEETGEGKAVEGGREEGGEIPRNNQSGPAEAPVPGSLKKVYEKDPLFFALVIVLVILMAALVAVFLKGVKKH